MIYLVHSSLIVFVIYISFAGRIVNRLQQKDFDYQWSRRRWEKEKVEKVE